MTATGSGAGGAGRVPALDGLRGVAIALVVLYHFHVPAPTLEHLRGGWAGVDVFFVLSGFLITSILIDECESSGTISFRLFYKRRWRRLGPPLLVMVAAAEVVTAFVAWPGTTGTYSLSARLANLGELFSLGINWWGIAGAHAPPIFGAMWSLAVEEQFYLLWPLIIVLAYRQKPAQPPRRLLLLAAVGGAVLSAAECFALYPSHADQTRIYFATDTRAQGLLVGAALALLWQAGWRIPQRLSQVLATLGCMAIAAIALNVDDGNPLRVNGSFTLLAASTAAVILNLLSQPQSRLARLLSLRPLRYLGLRSYALYLWHAPVAALMYVYGSSTSSTRWGWPGYLGGMAASVLLAEISWRLIEHRRPRRRNAGACPKPAG